MALARARERLALLADEAHHPLPHERAPGQDRPALQNGAQVSSQLAGCLVALFWIFRQALEDDRLQVARQTRAELSGPGRLIADDLPDHSLRRGRIKHRAPRGQLVERGTEAVEIAALIDRAFERFGLLRTHVSRRPHEGTAHGKRRLILSLRKAKVGKPDDSFWVEQKV